MTSRELVRTPVSRLLYGNFIESGFGRQVDGMWAEMLFNRSFETVPPRKQTWMRYPEGTDLTKLSWWHSGYEENAWRLLPGNPDVEFRSSSFMGFHHGKRSANIVNQSKTSPGVLAQGGLAFGRGRSYFFRGYAKSGLGPARTFVTVSLTRGAETPLFERQFPLQAQGWTEMAVEFANRECEGRGALQISVPPGANVFIQSPSSGWVSRHEPYPAASETAAGTSGLSDGEMYQRSALRLRKGRRPG